MHNSDFFFLQNFSIDAIFDVLFEILFAVIDDIKDIRQTYLIPLIFMIIGMLAFAIVCIICCKCTSTLYFFCVNFMPRRDLEFTIPVIYHTHPPASLISIHS